MKILISDTDGYQTFIETSIPSYDIGKLSVTFYTKWKGAKNPNVGKFEILAPDGKCFNITSGIPEFLKEHIEYNITKQYLYYVKRVGGHNGWKVTKIN